MTDYQKPADNKAREARLSPPHPINKDKDDLIIWFMEFCKAKKISIDEGLKVLENILSKGERK